jgi:hypothetical protein
MPELLLLGCSFTYPEWQKEIPWSVQLSKTLPCYISAKAGMGIKGICSEGLSWLKTAPNVNTVIVILPTLWRMDFEMDEENYLCNSMTHLLVADSGTYKVNTHATRKWITSGGLNYPKDTEQSKIFDLMYKHQGFFVILKDHLMSLHLLIDYCKINNIDLHISTIQDPLDQFTGLEYIKESAIKLLHDVNYMGWFKFDGKFIDKFLGHSRHPTTEEHSVLCDYILKQFKENNYGNKTVRCIKIS